VVFPRLVWRGAVPARKNLRSYVINGDAGLALLHASPSPWPVARRAITGHEGEGQEPGGRGRGSSQEPRSAVCAMWYVVC
jgi:hypothetical protein